MKPSLELTQAYKEIIGTLKCNMVRHKFERFLWIGKDAIDLLNQKRAQVLGM